MDSRKNQNSFYAKILPTQEIGVSSKKMLSPPTLNAFNLNSDSAVFTSGTACWDVSAIDATTFTPYFRDDFGASYNADNIGYLWHDVPGLQKFGVYEGNGNDNGPYVELGFSSSILWVKNIDASGDWVIHDNKRDTFNPSDSVLKPNTSGSKDSSTSNYVDFLSNGFKIRNLLKQMEW